MTIHPAVRAELDQTPAWWDAQFRALERKQIPRAASYHEGHELDEPRTYADINVRTYCIDCGVGIDPYEQEEES